MGDLVVGTRNILEIQIISKLSNGELSYREAIEILQVSERSLRRWLRSYEEKGIAFVRHGNKGKTPHNKSLSPNS